MPSNSDKKLAQEERCVVYMPRTLYLALKSKLALRGTSVSEWMREQVKREVEGRRRS